MSPVSKTANSVFDMVTAALAAHLPESERHLLLGGKAMKVLCIGGVCNGCIFEMIVPDPPRNFIKRLGEYHGYSAERIAKRNDPAPQRETLYRMGSIETTIGERDERAALYFLYATEELSEWDAIGKVFNGYAAVQGMRHAPDCGCTYCN